MLDAASLQFGAQCPRMKFDKLETLLHIFQTISLVLLLLLGPSEPHSTFTRQVKASIIQICRIPKPPLAMTNNVHMTYTVLIHKTKATNRVCLGRLFGSLPALCNAAHEPVNCTCKSGHFFQALFCCSQFWKVSMPGCSCFAA